MNPKTLKKLGVRRAAMHSAFTSLRLAREAGIPKIDLFRIVESVVQNPGGFVDDLIWSPLATALAAPPDFVEREVPAPYGVWGSDIEESALDQMRNACSLPVAIAGAVMPDAHLGYGLPIGGVLATKDVVIPYAVGVDIACRMRLTVFDLPASLLGEKLGWFSQILEEETRFGKGVEYEKRLEHPVMDEDWAVTAVTERSKDNAWAQLGTSGSGNHFVEFGVVESDQGVPHIALLSHSGSRGTGYRVAKTYHERARDLHPELPKRLRDLAWLALDSHLGHEYWNAMQLMGKYAAANHELIHHRIACRLGAQEIFVVENHHNFAWKEKHAGEDVVIHRKGATPAWRGTVGVIPGSMATATYIVEGKGNEQMLHSASHGAGRRMSRSEATKTLSSEGTRKFLEDRGVTLLSGGLDESPFAYKDIEEVMLAQRDSVRIIGKFEPKIVKMAP